MATIMDSIQYTLEQRIVPTIYEAGWQLDPVYPVIKRSSMNVVRDRGIGRGWNVLKTWKTGVAGGASFETAQGSNVMSGLNHSVVYDTPNSYQSVGECPHVNTFQSTVTLKRHKGNFYLPTTMMQADRLSASIGSMVAANLAGVAELLAQQEAAVFYSTSATTAQLVTLGNVASAITNKSGDTSTIILDLDDATASENSKTPTGRVHQLRPGMMVDFYDDTGATLRNAGFNVIVGNVDPLANTIEFTRVDGGTFQDTTTLGGGVTYNDASGADDDIVVIKGSVNVTPGSLETWIADGSTVTDFYGINVTNYGQFKSYLPSAALGAAATETYFNKWFGRFYEAFPGRRLDMALTTMGVLLGFIDNIDSLVQGGTEGPTDNKPAYPGRFMYDRNGKSLMVEAGWEAFRYRFASRPVEFFTSTQINAGSLYSGQMRNGGLTRYVPPTLPGAKTDSRLGSEVTWVAPLGGAGHQGIFKHAHSTAGATTEFVEAPFFRHWVVMPDVPNWLKVGGITEISW